MAARTTINGYGPFYEAPSMCGVCKCSVNSDMHNAGGRSYCTLFDKRKNYYDSPPRRCAEMFEKALAIGGDVVLVLKEQ